jgi:hypothetical protein
MEQSVLLPNAPIRYAPKNELGVVFIFASVAKKLGFHVEKIRPGFPDCLAYKKIGNKEKLVRIEFEFNSSNFKSHKHNSKNCDCIICWNHDWVGVPENIEVIELKKYFGVNKKVWIQPVIKSQWKNLEAGDKLNWGLSKRASPGDLLLMYRCFPEKCIKDIFVLESYLTLGNATWKEGICNVGQIKRLCILKSPLFLEDFKKHRVLSTSSFIRKNMQGNLLVSEYWHYLYDMITIRNPLTKKILSKYAPDKI